MIGLIVGKAMSGAFLAHGYQANRLIAFNDKGVLIHAMGKESAARITLRTVEALEKLAATIPPMAYDISNYATLGLLASLLDISNPDAPSDNDLAQVKTTLQQAISDARQDATLKNRLGAINIAPVLKLFLLQVIYDLRNCSCSCTDFRHHAAGILGR
ncbi:MAG: mdcE [Enterobacter mori]|nr:mdcE [Enterobacter mori]